MSENVKLVNMKQYAIERLSISDTNGGTPKHNGMANGGYHGNENGGPAGRAANQNGFMVNHEYADFDTATSPTSTEDMSSVPPRLPRSRPGSAKPKEKFIPENDIEIPADGSLHEYSVDDMSTFLRYMGVEERIVTHVHKKGLDGHKFSKLKDTDLETLGMKNPIICHFRDKSIKNKSGSRKKSLPFMML